MKPSSQNKVDSHLAVCDEVVQLSRIYEAETTLAVLKRPHQLALEKVARQVRLFHPIVFAARPDEAGDLLAERLKATHATVDNLDSLLDDMAQWIAVYGSLLEPQEVGVRLAVLESAMCPAFHVDYVGVRLVTTYSGPGSEYLLNHEINRDRLGYIGRGETLEESGLLKPAATIQHVPTQAVALFKGEAWQDNLGNGIVHRSPEVSGTKRLVLTLDARFGE